MGISLEQLKNTVTSIKGYVDDNKTNISSDAGNAISQKDDGIYVSAPAEVAVTQVLTEGTEIGSVTVGSTETKLYAPTPIAASWENVSDKPFTSLDSENFTVDESGVLSVTSSGGDTTIDGDVYYSYDEYSTEEKVIGRWTDGKPIYRKITDLSEAITISNSAWTNTIISNSGISLILLSSAISSTGSITPCSCSIDTGDYIRLKASRDGDSASSIVTIILEYIKTTDSENSFTPSLITDNKVLISSAPYYEDYSTEEKVIGCWVDGRPVYRKFFDISGAASGGTVNTVGDISYIKDIIYCCGLVYSSEDDNPGNSNVFCRKYSDTQFKLYCSEGFTSAKHIIVEYTKITDAENSFTPDMIKESALIDTVKDSDVADIISVLEEE